MSRFCRTATDRRAGFLLLEALVALAIAALVLAVLAQIISSARHASRRPMEQMSSLSVARIVANALSSSSLSLAREGQFGRFSYVARTAPVEISTRASRLAPAPSGIENSDKRSGAGPPGRVPQLLTVVVAAPSGRRLVFETIASDRSD
jgi:hypothetical protein